jgi:hypothetical protein
MNQIYDLDKMHLQTIRIRREYPFRERKSPVPLAWQQKQAIIETNVYGGPRNSDSVLSYTWEQKRGGPSGEFEEEAHTVI